MIRVIAPSRLHFGLIAPAATTSRRYGGVGLMIDRPGLELTVVDSSRWHVEGALAERAQGIIDRLISRAPQLADRPLSITIVHAAPEHMGLGTGTQLSLAVARAVFLAAFGEMPPVVELARLTGRGARSGIGVHGFARGGFLVDEGKSSEGEVAPLATRFLFPEEWPIVLVLPPWPPGLSGLEEHRAFQDTLAHDPVRAARLCSLVYLEILPALAGRRFRPFGEALHEFNRLAGEWFHGVQGGVYAGTQVAELIAYLSTLGPLGVAQSSWGPGVCAVCEHEEQADGIVRAVCRHTGFGADRVLVVRAANHGATVLQGAA